MTRAPASVLASVLALVACAREGGARPLAFEPIAPGFSTARVEVAAEPAFTAIAFDIDLTRVDVRLARPPGGAPLATVDQMVAGAPSHLAVNASFFDVDGKTMGRASDRSGIQNPDRRPGWGALIVDANDDGRVVLGDALPKEPRAGELVVQGVPRLVVGGSVMKLKAQTAARTAVCAAGKTLTLVVTTEADTGALAAFLARPRSAGGLGCKDALNLDGGPSTQLFAQLGAFRLALPGGSGVPNALVFTPRAPDAARAPAPVAVGAAAPDAGAPAARTPDAGPSLANATDAGATGP